MTDLFRCWDCEETFAFNGYARGLRVLIWSRPRLTEIVGDVVRVVTSHGPRDVGRCRGCAVGLGRNVLWRANQGALSLR